MTSEFYKAKVNEAHEYLDEGDYTKAISVLNNLKTRIHEPEAKEDIKLHDVKVEQEYKKRYDGEKTANGDPLERYTKAAEFIALLNEWHAKEYLSFYDELRKKYDGL